MRTERPQPKIPEEQYNKIVIERVKVKRIHDSSQFKKIIEESKDSPMEFYQFQANKIDK